LQNNTYSVDDDAGGRISQAPEPSNRVFFLSAESAQDVSKWESVIRYMDHFETRQREV